MGYIAGKRATLRLTQKYVVQREPFAAVAPIKLVDGTAKLPGAGFAWRRSSPKAAAIAISSQVTVRVHHLK